MKPKLIKYFDTSYERNVTEYLINEDSSHVYLCTPTAFRIAEQVGMGKNLHEVNARSLPVNWCKYQDLYNTNNSEVFSKIIKKNYKKILELVKNNKKSVIRIVEFFEEFNDNACKKDFTSVCRVAHAITINHVSYNTMQNLFNIVFDYYEEIVSENMFPLLLDMTLNEYFIPYKKNNRIGT